MSLCLCKYVNGKCIQAQCTSIVFRKKFITKAYEFVRRHIHGRMRKPSACYIRTHARYLEKAHAPLLITCSGEVYGILLRERRNLSR